MRGDWKEEKSSQLLAITDQNLIFATWCCRQDAKCWCSPAPFWKTPQPWNWQLGEEKAPCSWLHPSETLFPPYWAGIGVMKGADYDSNATYFCNSYQLSAGFQNFFFFCMSLRSFPEDLKVWGFIQQFSHVLLGSRTMELLTLPSQKRNSHTHSKLVNKCS